MVDFHSHILPGIDDGSKNVEMSLKLLELEQQQGVKAIVLTPHFYADQNSPDRFLYRRQRSWEALASELWEDAPALYLGAEVQYFEGIGNVEDLRSLCIVGTNLLLLEMPFFQWDSRTIRTVLDIQNDGQVQIVLAHIDRYLKMQPAKVWEEFRNFDIKMQVNADFFDGFFQKRKAMSMFRRNEFQLVGSDCHNLSSRKPNWNSVPMEVRAEATRNFAALIKNHRITL